jgi:hypothetical protein
VASRPQAPAAQLVCPAVAPAVGRIAGPHGGFRRQTLVDQVRSGPEMQRPEELSEAHPELLLAAMTEEHWEAVRLSAVVAQAVQDVPREAAEARDVPLAVVAEAVQDVPREAAEVRDERLAVVAEAAQDVPREAAEVRDERLAGVGGGGGGGAGRAAGGGGGAGRAAGGAAFGGGAFGGTAGAFSSGGAACATTSDAASAWAGSDEI